MSSAAFALVIEAPSNGGFWRGAARRFTWRSVASGVLVSVALTVVSEIALIPIDPGRLPPPITVAFMTGFLSIFVAVMLADEAVARGAPRKAAYPFAIALAAAFGAVAQWRVNAALGITPTWDLGPHMLWLTQPTGCFFLFTMVGALATGVYVNLRTAQAAIRRMHAAESARAAAQRRTIESQLQALQARIEPRFLFDTLARVRDLYEADAARASRMLDELIAYLRAALPHLRESASTLGREVELARAWLAIVAARADDGPRLDVDLEADTGNAPVPAMLLLPLVERALAAAGEGVTRVRLAALRSERRLRIELNVDSSSPGAEVAQSGIELLRERLRALFADAASIDWRSRPGGIAAAIELPSERAGAAR